MKTDVDSTYFKSSVRHRVQYLTMKLSFRVSEEAWDKLMDIAESSDMTISQLLRKALAPILELEDDFITYLPPLCPNCGAPLSAVLGTKKLYCMKCGRRYRLVEVDIDDK